MFANLVVLNVTRRALLAFPALFPIWKYSLFSDGSIDSLNPLFAKSFPVDINCDEKPWLSSAFRGVKHGCVMEDVAPTKNEELAEKILEKSNGWCFVEILAALLLGWSCNEASFVLLKDRWQGEKVIADEKLLFMAKQPRFIPLEDDADWRLRLGVEYAVVQ